MMNSRFSSEAYPLLPPPPKTFKQETSKSWNKFKTGKLTQYFFALTFIINHHLRASPVGHALPLTTLL